MYPHLNQTAAPHTSRSRGRDLVLEAAAIHLAIDSTCTTAGPVDSIAIHCRVSLSISYNISTFRSRRRRRGLYWVVGSSLENKSQNADVRGRSSCYRAVMFILSARCQATSSNGACVQYGMLCTSGSAVCQVLIKLSWFYLFGLSTSHLTKGKLSEFVQNYIEVFK